MVAARPPLAHTGVLLAGRFLIERQVGSGGMGAILRAVDQTTGTTVAIKVLNGGSSDPNLVERFLREARLLERLDHPAIVAYIAHGQIIEGVPYLAMDWVEGEDLAKRLRHRGLTLAESLQVVTRAADALGEVHRQGIVHRDVKPANLILRASDPAQVVLLDFGISRSDQSTMALTQYGAVLGTPEYMSPEQARGDIGLAPAADVFSLGCVLYECLTGSSPFAGEQIAAVLAKILFDEPEPLRRRRPEVPEDLADLVAAMLEKSPAKRPRDGAAVLRALQALAPVTEGGVAVTGNSLSQPPLTAREQQYISVVVARPIGGRRLSVSDYASILREGGPRSSSDNTALAGTLAMSVALEPDTLLGSRVLTGVRVETLLDGSLVAVVASGLPPTDQAMHAARLGLQFKERIADVMVAVATGRGVLSERLPIGDAIDRAVKLGQGPTGPGAEPLPPGVVVDEITAKLIENRFVLTREPGVAARLLRELYEADNSRPLLGKPTPCLGRDTELALLESLFTACCEEGTPSAVLLVAPPGMGKSRLRHEFVRRITGERADILVLLGRGDVMSAGSSYGLLSRAIGRLAEVQDGEPAEHQQEKLRQRISQSVPAGDVERVTSFIAEMCRIPFLEQASVQLRAARQDPKAMSDQVSRAFIDLLRAECNTRPVVLVLEDLHWGDALTVRLVQDALRALAEAPLMILATARPEVTDLFPKLWAGRLQVLPLTKLTNKACERLIKQVLGPTTPASVVSQIIGRAGGNALYLEELIRAAAEGNSGELPETVLAMVQARLLRIPTEARRILRAASVFGETFWRGGVLALCGGERRTPRIDSLLSTLVESETIESRPSSRFPGESEYIFRHALVRDAAYSMIPLEDQPGIHQRAGEYLEQAGERDPMILAEHFVRSSAPELAVKHFVQATEQGYANNDSEAILTRAQRGIDCGATGEARGILRALQGRAYGWKEDWTAAYRDGMESLDLLPPGHMWWYRSMSNVLFGSAMGGMQNEFPALMARFTAARPLPDGRGAYVEAGSSLALVLSLLGMRARARALLADLEATAGDLIESDSTTQGFMRYAQAISYRFCEADPWTMLRLATQSYAAFEAAVNLHSMVLARGILAAAHLDLGDLALAESVARTSYEMAQKLGDKFMISQAAMFLAQVLATRGSAALEEALQICQDVMTASDKPIFVGRVGATLAQLLIACGDIGRAVQVGRKAVEQLLPIATEHQRGVIILADALRLNGEPQAARELCEQTWRRFEQLQSNGFSEVGLLRAMAEAQNACGAKAEAQAALQLGLSRLQARADLIPEPAAKARYLAHPIDSAPLFQLAAKWGGLSS